ncbi:AbiH family protein [uncultured Aquimarina sp.]|uniref:AbiH family protein n=1 Tax=uncultured Aquimarina sp. TaxID=575652 RepID=UPI00261B7DD0|nr:AbiH family protein [uncultured Aquimarina sp.]
MELEVTRNLIIVGNGFDLAHGLKTSYEDFLFDYFVKSFDKALKSDNGNKTGMYDYKDRLFNFRINSRGYFDNLKNNSKSLNEIKSIVSSNSGWVRIEPLTPFSRDIYNKQGRWVDIEGIFYRQLKIIYENNSIARTKEEKKKLFMRLNEEMNYLKGCLEEYLNLHYKENKPKDLVDDLFFARHLFPEDDRVDHKILSQNHGKHKFYMVNFNYTITANKYRQNKFADSEIQVNYIHGKIKDPQNPIIFGYGDEKDKNYKGIEDLEVDEAFENIKSFGYLQNDNYQNLLGFINGGKFNVVIVGHSCGLSDRTLLSTIFEHPDCEKIRVCYYEKDGWKDFTNKTYQMSRHFDDKKILRERILSPKDYDRIPQYND